MLFYLADVQAISNQFVRIDANLVFPCGAAEATHIDDIGNRTELLLENPIFERFQRHHIETRVVALKRIPIDLPDRAVVRADLGLQSARQVHLRQPFQNLLPIPVISRFIVENQTQARKSENGDGPQMIQVGDAIHGDFERNRDLLFHLLRGPARPLRNHLNVVIGYVGICLDGQVVKGDSTPDEKQESDKNNQKAIVQGKVDEGPKSIASSCGEPSVCI